jgi:hypothetical protein
VPAIGMRHRKTVRKSYLTALRAMRLHADHRRGGECLGNVER